MSKRAKKLKVAEAVKVAGEILKPGKCCVECEHKRENDKLKLTLTYVKAHHDEMKQHHDQLRRTLANVTANRDSLRREKDSEHKTLSRELDQRAEAIKVLTRQKETNEKQFEDALRDCGVRCQDLQNFCNNLEKDKALLMLSVSELKKANKEFHDCNKVYWSMRRYLLVIFILTCAELVLCAVLALRVFLG
jgi:septal ring factor EnvC (AmiA/AmiB activator)